MQMFSSVKPRSVATGDVVLGVGVELPLASSAGDVDRGRVSVEDEEWWFELSPSCSASSC